MNIGKVFEEDGVYKFVAKLGDRYGLPPVKRFASLSEVLEDLRSAGFHFDEVLDFCLGSLQSGELVELPGRTEDWVAYLGPLGHSLSVSL